MEDLAARFCREAARRSGLRYSEEVRQLAIGYARGAKSQGHTGRRIAARLGLSEWTLSRWLRREEERDDVQSLRWHEVKVLEPEVLASHPVLVMPSGVRVEGLSMSDLAMLLRGLG